LDKDFAGGVGVRLFNKSKPSNMPVIPTFEPMLCESINKSDGTIDFSRMNFPCFGETKLDGVRVIFMKKDGEIKCLARSGKEYVNFTKITEQVTTLLTDVDDIFLDGEIHGTTFDAIMEVAKAKRPTDSDAFTYSIWDTAPVSVFEGESCGIKLKERRNNLSELFANHTVEVNLTFKNLAITTTHTLVDESTALKFLKTCHDAGEEGVVLKNMDGLYRPKRHKDWIKGKMFHEESFTIIGVEEHSKKFEQLGSLVCVMDDSKNTFKVGSGFTDVQRISLWEQRDDLVGMEVDVRFKNRSKNTLQFPTFIKLRSDRV
jgi:DNA ligase-1